MGKPVLALIIMGAVLLGADGRAARQSPPPCPGGRYLVAGAPIVRGAAPIVTDGVVIGTGQIALDARCPVVQATLKGTKRGTTVRALWPACTGIAGKVRLKGRIDATCRTLTGKLVARKAKVVQEFTATLSTCGDGLLDAGGGEQCEIGAACPGDVACTEICTCAASTTATTTTTTRTTSTTATVTTSTRVDATVTTTTGPPTTTLLTTTTTSTTTSTTAPGPGTTTTTLPTEPPPDPATVAPPLDRSATTGFAAATAFLFAGTSPIQVNVAPGAIEPERAAVIRGRTLARDGTPIGSVLVSVLGHPEFGQTLTRADGMFDLAVSGGGPLTVEYAKPGFLTTQRQADVPWQDYVRLSDVKLVPLDAEATVVDLAAATPVHVARGSAQADADGTRQATLLVPRGTAAEMVMPDGSAHAMDRLTVRATEYTVGEAGPESMPGVLPPTSGYTYAVELSVDEAMAAGATTVRFDRPLPFYVENFLGFPVGMAVPAGYYDRQLAAWVPSENGRVIGVVAVTGGLAELDVTGDGTADTGSALTELGITDAERSELGRLYGAGQSLWRVPMTHFTPWDCNWPFGPPPDAEAPDVPDPVDDTSVDAQCMAGGSVIECEGQVLGETLPIAGTPFTLHYRSDRVPGRTAGRSLEIPLSGASVPGSLLGIRLRVEVAGQIHEQAFGTGTNQRTTFVWNGRDAYGREMQGGAVARGVVQWVYQAVYLAPEEFGAAFARFGSGAVTGVQARQEVSISRPFETVLGAGGDARGIGLGGWTLDVHHAYDPTSRVLQEGNGRRRRAESLGRVIDSVLEPEAGPVGRVGTSSALAVGPDGSIYFSPIATNTVRRLAPDGTITTIAGGGRAPFPFFGDGGPALEANLLLVDGIHVAPNGSLYLQAIGSVLRRVDPDGIIRTAAGRWSLDGNNRCDRTGADGVPATETDVCVVDVAVAPDGSVYISDQGNFDAGTEPRVRRIGPDGIITTVAGTGERCSPFFSGDPCGDGGPATEAKLDNAGHIALGPDGSLYLTQANRIRRVSPEGIIETIAGSPTGRNGFSGDGGPATDALLFSPLSPAVGPDGALYFLDAANNRIRRIDADGIISSIAGAGETGVTHNIGQSGDRGPARQALIGVQRNLHFAPDDTLVVVAGIPGRIRRIGPALPGFAEADHLIPSEDGNALYVFDASGRHLQTLSLLTRAPLLEFGYHADGRLAQITQKTAGTDNTTTIERDASGTPTAIVGPFGDRTTLAVDANGFLARVANPAGEAVELAATALGLLTGFTDPRASAADPAAHTTVFAYDAGGRLERDTDPVDAAQTLVRDETTERLEVARTTALDRTTRYRVESLPGGIQRRTVTAPDGTADRSERPVDGGEVVLTRADGSTLTHLAAPDPRFGMLAPTTAALTLKLPSGLESALTAVRTATLADPFDVTSLRSLVDEITLAGAKTTVAYDVETRTFTFTSPAGRTRTVVLDAQSRPVRLEAPGFEPTVVAYDARGRLERVSAGADASARTLALAYGADGRIERATDPLGRTVRYTYDAAGRLASSTFDDGRVVGFAYDRAGHLTALTPPGRSAHRFEYDRRGELVTIRPPDLVGSGPTQYTVDADRQLAAVDRPDGDRLALTYDAGGRITKRALVRAGSPVAEYTATYDAAGRGETFTAPGGVTLTRTHDGPFRVREEWSGPVAGHVALTPDAALRPASERVNDAHEVAFAHDPDGFLTAAGDLTIARDAVTGLPTGTSLGVVSDAWEHDGFGAVRAYSARANGDARYAATFTRDDLGRITETVETTASGERRLAYTYDTADRLTEVRHDGALVEQYAYDANGNRTSATLGTSSTATYDAHDRLLTHGPASLVHDANGRLVERTQGPQRTTYRYDAFGNLDGVTLPDGRVVSYVLDPRGRRIGKRVDGTLVQGFLYAGDFRPVAELDGAGTVVARFVYAGGAVPAYVVKGGVAFRLVTDEVGSVRMVLNAATGAVEQRIEYDGFGGITSQTSAGFQPFGFAGGLHDRDTGLVHLGAREYDPATGRFTTPDPIRFAGGDTNLYVYAGNDPVNRVDPLGLFDVDWNSFLAGVVHGVGQAAVGLVDMVLPGVTQSIEGIIDGIEAIAEMAGTHFDADPFGLMLDALDLETTVNRGSPEFFAGSLCGEIGAGAATGGAGAARGALRGAAKGAERKLLEAAGQSVARGPRAPALTTVSVKEAEALIARSIDNDIAAAERATAEQARRAAQEAERVEVIPHGQGGRVERGDGRHTDALDF
jgi:RHS repeat-associated protein